jgi:hypothetical protein
MPETYDDFLDRALAAPKPNYTQIQLKLAEMHEDFQGERTSAYKQALSKVRQHMENAFNLASFD